MKFKISKADFENLSDDQKTLYKSEPDSNGKHVLKVEGMPDVEGLISRISSLESSMTALETNNKNLKQEKDEALEKLEQAQNNKDKDDNNVEAVTRTYEKKLEKKDQLLANATEMLEKLTTGADAQKLSSDIAVEGSSAVLIPHVGSRLRAEIDLDNKTYKTVVLDENGNDTAFKLDDLANEFRNNSAFGTVIRGSNADGEGHQHDGGSGSAAQKEMKRSAFNELSPTEQAAFAKDGGRLTDD